MARNTEDAATRLATLRLERKFLVTQLEPAEMELMVRLHPAGFREVFPPRDVNNIYLDSHDLKHYCDNLDGVCDRVKVRVRWYGRLFGRIDEPKLELKIKQGLLGRKEAFKLAPFDLDSSFDSGWLRRLAAESGLPIALAESLSALTLSLLNRYRRRYFLSSDGYVRLTLDTRREFFRIRPRINHFLAFSSGDTSTILELKYSPEHDLRASTIASKLPLRLTKSSKYVQGLEGMWGI